MAYMSLRAAVARHASIAKHANMPPLYLLPANPLEEMLKVVGTDPFWGYVWPGSYAIHRYLLDNPELASSSKVVLDFGTGCGLASLTAKRLGAGRVIANDVCAFAAEAVKVRARIRERKAKSER